MINPLKLHIWTNKSLYFEASSGQSTCVSLDGWLNVRNELTVLATKDGNNVLLEVQ